MMILYNSQARVMRPPYIIQLQQAVKAFIYIEVKRAEELLDRHQGVDIPGRKDWRRISAELSVMSLG